MSDSNYRTPKTASFSMADNRVLIEADAEESKAWLAKAEAGDFVVRLEDRLAEGSEVLVVLQTGAIEVELRCRVKQVFRSGVDRHGTMVEWLDRASGPSSGNPVRPLSGQRPGEVASGRVVAEPTPSVVAEELAPQDHRREDDSSAFDVAVFKPDAGSDADPVPVPVPDATATSSESGDQVAGEERPSSDARISVAREAEQGADALEALLSESDAIRHRIQKFEKKRRRSPASYGDDSGGGSSDEDESGEEGEGADGSSSGALADPTLTPEAKQAFLHNETRGVSLSHTIGKMNPNEKARLAVRASRQERRLLLRDHTFSVQMGLLNNPRIENKELLAIAKHPQTTGGILKRLASDRRFTGNYEIQLALVKHPGTPSPIAIRLLEQLRVPDLRVLAKSQALRENVRRAALRLYLQRAP